MHHDRNRTERLRQAGFLLNIQRNPSRNIFARHQNAEQNPLISEIQVSTNDEIYHVRAFFPDPFAYTRGLVKLKFSQTRYYELEGILSGQTCPSIKLETNNRQLFLFFINELLRMSPGLITSGLLQTLSSNHISLNDAYQSLSEIPTWDICKTVTLGRGMNYECINTSPQARIRSITVLLENEGPAFNLKIKCNNEENLNIFKSTYRVEGEQYDTSDGILYYHINQSQPESIRKLGLFMAKLQQFESLLSGEYLTRIIGAINSASVIGSELIPTTAQGSWAQVGEWVDRLNATRGPVRHVEFVNPRLGTPVRKIFLSEYDNGELKVTIDIDYHRYETFRIALDAQDLPNNVNYNRTLAQISLKAPHSSSPFLTSFLIKAYQVEGSIGSVINQISTLINETMRRRAPRPPAIIHPRDREDAMEIDTPELTTQNNHESIVFDQRIVRSEKIFKIALNPALLNAAGSFHVSVQFQPGVNAMELYEDLVDTQFIMAEVDHEPSDAISYLFDRAALDAEMKLCRFLFKVQNFDTQITEDVLNSILVNIRTFIRRPQANNAAQPAPQNIPVAAAQTPASTTTQNLFADTQQAEALSFAEHYGHTSATYRPSQSIGPAMPDIGANAKALDGMDVDVPEHLTCKLSLEIMTDPVCFADIANQDCYEYAWIMEHLRKSNTHPLTRQPVTKEMLMSILAVKKECDKFTIDQMKVVSANNTNKI